MKQSELKQIIRAVVPGATTQKVPDTLLELLLNKAVQRVNSDGKILRAEKYFDVEGDQKTYDMATIVDDFVLIGEGGLYFNNGTEDVTNYVQLEGTNRATLNKKQPNWVNASSSTPKKYIVELNKIIVTAPPSDDLTNGFWLPDYIKKPNDMTNGEHYPFSGNTTEYAFLEPLDDAILAYVRWLLKLSVGEKQEGIMTLQEYHAVLNDQLRETRRRPDYKANHNFRWRG